MMPCMFIAGKLKGTATHGLFRSGFRLPSIFFYPSAGERRLRACVISLFHIRKGEKGTQKLQYLSRSERKNLITLDH